jgi:cysteine desulfurase/selenocysteine lyase
MRNLKKAFPKQEAKRKCVFLNNARTTLQPSISLCARQSFSRLVTRIGIQALFDHKIKVCRQKIAALLKCTEAEIFFFPQGCTTALNYVAITLAQKIAECKDRSKVIISQAEHHSNYVPWLAYFKDVDILPLDAVTKEIILPAAAEMRKAVLLSLSAKSNVLGRLWNNSFADLADVVRQAHDVGCPVLLDGAQVVLDPMFNLQKVKADFFVFSAHKIYGPPNLGILFMRNKMQQSFPVPDQTYRTMPLFEIMEFERSLHFVKKAKVSKILLAEEALARDLKVFLEQFSFVRVVSNGRGNIVTFVTEGIHSHDLADILAQEGIFIRAGDHCAKPLHDALAISNSSRVSFACYNDKKDLAKFKQAFIAACDFLLQK